MKCRGCNKDLDTEDYKMVAQWPFCSECFDGLMKSSQQRPTEKPHEAVAPRIEAEPHLPRCDMCKRDLEAGEGKRLAIWTLCPGCYQDLLSPAPLEEARPDSDQTALPGAEGSDGLSDTAHLEREESIHSRTPVQLPSSVPCAGCGRPIPKAGGRLVEGAPYCPECFYAMSNPQNQNTSHSDSTEPADPERQEVHLESRADPEGLPRCAACNRSTQAELLERVEGFEICQACLSTDPELAVQIAREKHRRALLQLRSQLERQGE